MTQNAIKIEVFQGPLDLLLSLISKNEIDIYDIPIHEITSQYLDYIYVMNELNIELASEFIVMAAHLIEIKSKMMLPPDDEQDEDILDPRDELMRRLVEYKVFKQISSYIQDQEGQYLSTISREASYIPELQTDYTDLDIDMSLLAESMQKILARHRVKMQDLPQHYTIEAENVSVGDKMIYINQKLSDRDRINFFDLFRDYTSKAHIVATFLAILELLKRNLILLHQQDLFEDIIIKKCQVE